MSPVALVQEFFAALEALDVDRAVSLFADDAVQTMPFAPAGFPDRLEGRDAIARQYGGLPAAYRSMRFVVNLYPMEDASMVVAEYQGAIELTAGGRYDNRYCGIFRVRDDRIASFTEYFDPVVLQRAFGGDQMTDTFSIEPDR